MEEIGRVGTPHSLDTAWPCPVAPCSGSAVVLYCMTEQRYDAAHATYDTTLNDDENLQKSESMMGREAREERALTCGA